MQASLVVARLRAHILFMVVSVKVVDRSDETKDERCETFISIGRFHTEVAGREWERRFKTIAGPEGVEVIDSWISKMELNHLRVVDFDPNTRAGTPQNIIARLHEYVPDKERREIGEWLALARPL